MIADLFSIGTVHFLSLLCFHSFYFSAKLHTGGFLLHYLVPLAKFEKLPYVLPSRFILKGANASRIV